MKVPVYAVQMFPSVLTTQTKLTMGTGSLQESGARGILASEANPHPKLGAGEWLRSELIRTNYADYNPVVI